MNEKALLFGETKSLVGVVTDPSDSVNPNGRPGVVLLNAGIIHHVGPNRIHVKVARKLASDGFVVMRFDYSGIGDSPARTDNLPFAVSAVQETRQCLDYLESSRNVSRFILMGICSGADNGLRAATNDDRVIGAILIESHPVPTLGYLLHLYRDRFLQPSSWTRFLFGKSELWLELSRLRSSRRPPGSTTVSQQYAAPSSKSLTDSIWMLAERGAHLLLIYSEASPSHYFYKRSIRKKIAPLLADGRVREHIIRGSDHIFTHPTTQTNLFDSVFNWIEERRTMP
jgi:hypothetical protein